MTAFNPEIIYSDGATERDQRSWHSRSWEKLKRWSQGLANQFVEKGYGGLQLSAPVAGLGAITTTPTKIGGSAYDNIISPEPLFVSQDLANGRVAIQRAGMWYVTMNISGLIVPVTQNASNTIALAVYNETDGIPSDQPGYFTIPRYGETFDISLSSLFYMPAAHIGKYFSLYIWILNASPSITVTDLESLELSVFRVQ